MDPWTKSETEKSIQKSRMYDFFQISTQLGINPNEQEQARDAN